MVSLALISNGGQVASLVAATQYFEREEQAVRSIQFEMLSWLC